ncbi:hypothetical protein ACFL0V_01165 [Nanoarchaeota archaeon]
MKFLYSESDEEKTINYKFACKQIVPKYRLIGYKESTLFPNKNRIITYTDLQKSDNLRDDEFNQLKGLIKSTTIDLKII